MNLPEVFFSGLTSMDELILKNNWGASFDLDKL